MEKEKLLGLMKGQLIVSCQALPGEAFYDETISLMDRFAIAAQRAGAARSVPMACGISRQ